MLNPKCAEFTTPGSRASSPDASGDSTQLSPSAVFQVAENIIKTLISTENSLFLFLKKKDSLWENKCNENSGDCLMQ